MRQSIFWKNELVTRVLIQTYCSAVSKPCRALWIGVINATCPDSDTSSTLAQATKTDKLETRRERILVFQARPTSLT